MKDLTEPLLPDPYQEDDEDVCEKKSVSLKRLRVVAMITITTFILFIIFLLSQLPPQQTMWMPTIAIQSCPPNLKKSGLFDLNVLNQIYSTIFQGGCGRSMENTSCLLGGVLLAVSLRRLQQFVRGKGDICLLYRVKRRMRRLR